MSKILYSLGLIGFGLALGYLFQVLVGRGRISPPIPKDNLRKLLQKIALPGLNPVAIVGAVWIVELRNPRLIALPFTGLFALIAGGLLALGAARILRLKARKTGAIVTAENNVFYGGLGSAVAEVLVEHLPVPMKRIGVQDTFAESGPYLDLLDKYGLSAPHIITPVGEVIVRKN